MISRVSTGSSPKERQISVPVDTHRDSSVYIVTSFIGFGKKLIGVEVEASQSSTLK